MTPLSMMFLVLFIALFIGIPVGFSIGISTMTFLLMNNSKLVIMVMRSVDGAKSFTLMALPLFVFAGALMAYGSTPRLMKLANLLLRKIPGGLGATAMAACGFFGAVSGSGVASTAAIGGIIGHEMVRQGYSKGITASLIAAGGTMASLIPPSIVMVVYAASAGVSVGDMFLAGFGPGILTILALIGLNMLIAIKRKTINQVQEYTSQEKRKIVIDALLPLMMPVVIIGGVLSGLTTPTEAAVIATVYALALAVFVYRELNFRQFMRVASESVVTSAVILMIIGFATPFGWIMATQNVPQMFTKALLAFTNSNVMILIIFFALLLFLGCFMETICIIILMTPILLPITTAIGIHPVHWGIALLMNLAVGGITPPLSVCLFTSCRILKMRVEETFPDLLYVILTVTLVAVVTLAWPDLSMFLVRMFGSKV